MQSTMKKSAVAFIAMAFASSLALAGNPPPGPAGNPNQPGSPAVSSEKHPNNGFGNGGGDGVPGNSGNNPSPNAAQKAADVVR